jgi:DNA-binding transcriptional ArsR family regulator
MSRLERIARGLSGAELYVAVLLTSAAREIDGWVVQMSVSEIVRRSGMSRETVVLALGALARAGLVTMQRGDSRRSAAWYRLEWLRTLEYEPPESPLVGKSDHSSSPLVGKSDHSRSPLVGKSDHSRSPLVGKSDHSRSPLVGKSDHSSSPLVGKSDHSQGLLDLSIVDSKEFAREALARATRATRARQSDQDLDLKLIDQSIQLRWKAKTDEAGPEAIERARGLMEGYLRTPHLCRIPPQEAPPARLVKLFLAMGSIRELEGLLLELRAERQVAYSYGWFPVIAAERLHGIPPEEFKAGGDGLALMLKALSGGKPKSQAAAAGEDFRSEIGQILSKGKRVS